MGTYYYHGVVKFFVGEKEIFQAEAEAKIASDEKNIPNPWLDIDVLCGADFTENFLSVCRREVRDRNREYAIDSKPSELMNESSFTIEEIRQVRLRQMKHFRRWSQFLNHSDQEDTEWLKKKIVKLNLAIMRGWRPKT